MHSPGLLSGETLEEPHQNPAYDCKEENDEKVWVGCCPLIRDNSHSYSLLKPRTWVPLTLTTAYPTPGVMGVPHPAPPSLASPVGEPRDGKATCGPGCSSILFFLEECSSWVACSEHCFWLSCGQLRRPVPGSANSCRLFPHLQVPSGQGSGTKWGSSLSLCLGTCWVPGTLPCHFI